MDLILLIDLVRPNLDLTRITTFNNLINIKTCVIVQKKKLIEKI